MKAATSASIRRPSRSIAGDFVFLVGSTGSGKSTVMRLLIKELEPTSGTIRVAGHDLSEIPRKRVPYYRRNLGVVFQDFKLLPNRTVYDNVAYALQVTGGSAQGDPRQGARHPAPDRPVDEAAQLPGPALGWRAAARLDRASVRQPSAAAAGRRADRATSIRRRASTSCGCSTGSTGPARPCLWRRHDQAMVDKMRRRVLELSRRADHP